MNKMILNDIENMMLYPKKCKSFANVDNVLDEWIRFLSYIKPEDVLFLKLCECKSLSDISDDEFEKYSKIKRQIKMSELFIKYKNKNCTVEEHNLVVRYMDNSLEDFMIKKLNDVELSEALILIDKFKFMSVIEQDEYIEKQLQNYYKLSICEAYVLYIIRDIRYNNYVSEVNRKINCDGFERASSLRKSLIKEYGKK